MEIKISGYIAPHCGEMYHNCADHYAIDEHTHSFAIADGVGGSLFPSFFAESLVRKFVEKPEAFFALEDGKMKLCGVESYGDDYEKHIVDQKKQMTDIQRFVFETKQEEINFAASTFVGCQFEESNNEIICKCFSLGDSYLFFISKDLQTYIKISSMQNKEFDVFPEYFASNGKQNGNVIEQSFKLIDGTLLLMTDAMSDWFIDVFNNDKSILHRLTSLRSHDDYVKLIEEERLNQKLKDDDSTLVIAEITNIKEEEILYTENNIDDINAISLEELKACFSIYSEEKKINEKENKQLKLAVKRLEKEVSLLKSEKIKLERNVDQLNSAEMKLENESKQLRTDKIKLEDENKQLRTDKIKLEDENKQLRTDKTKLEDENKQLRTDKIKLEDESKQLRTDKEQLENEVSQLKDENGELNIQSGTKSNNKKKTILKRRCDSSSIINMGLLILNTILLLILIIIKQLNVL